LRKAENRPLGEVIREVLSAYHLDEKMLEKEILRCWPEVVGKMVAAHTTKTYLRGHKLYVKIDSAPLRHELSFAREKLRKAINKHVGKDFLEELVIS
jgi:predicted nucleic acid-binding Zn ribbon protein